MIVDIKLIFTKEEFFRMSFQGFTKIIIFLARYIFSKFRNSYIQKQFTKPSFDLWSNLRKSSVKKLNFKKALHYTKNEVFHQGFLQ